MNLFDMHCHLDFMENAGGAAERAQALGIGCYSVTVTPHDYERVSREFAAHENVRVGLGLHPWWIADGSCGEEDIDRFGVLAAETRFIGEVGLDFGKRCAGTEELQTAAFERIASACSQGGKVVSLHAVKAVGAVLDVLEQFSCLEGNACILHWFSGTSDELQRAIRMGCYFSVGPRMLAAKRGVEYVKAIPASRLLLETDAPPESGSTMPYDEIAQQLRETLERIERLRGDGVAEEIAGASKELLFSRACSVG
ncbi:TatD family hydrolase [Raoultibacter phocaeensis]|uniref:TatD family hydrolase n=1 Tax=Raoultibacter phocaeensis TaxID=2479841 RepID=UPI00111A7A90|nr:TatD family hydrolase [Raoultibacter phocaeensis]